MASDAPDVEAINDWLDFWNYRLDEADPNTEQAFEHMRALLSERERLIADQRWWMARALKAEAEVERLNRVWFNSLDDLRGAKEDCAEYRKEIEQQSALIAKLATTLHRARSWVKLASVFPEMLSARRARCKRVLDEVNAALAALPKSETPTA